MGADQRTLPGYFRPTKEWDFLVLSDRTIVACIEVKSQVGSFGNNFNNRVEEALGNATDFWAAYREGFFAPSPRPWVGYLFMLEEHTTSMRPKRSLTLDPYKLDETFQSKSYCEIYQETCRRLLREGLYDAACFFTSNREDGRKGKFTQPSRELSIRNFAISLHARAAAFAQVKADRKSGELF
jgi:hypothetical protein